MKEYSAIPGFKFGISFTLLYLSFVVLIPLSMIFVYSFDLSFADFWQIISNPRVIHSYKISFGLALIAGLVNAFFGLIIAWTLVRYDFKGKIFLDAMIDLPFALPTAVAGIALVALYSEHGWIGQFLEPLGLKIVFTPLGILLAMIFIGLPFVVRTIQPVLENFEKELEESATCLGASRFQIFQKIIFPELFPAIATGFVLAFARAVGEYGSVVFIAGNIPMVSEIAPLLIISKLEQFDYQGASAIALVMLITSFIIIFLINLLQRWRLNRA